MLGGEQICVIHFSAITILRLKEQIQNKHKKSLKFILMRCFTCSEENKFVSFIFLCNHNSSFKRANPKQTQKIAYIYTHELFCMIGGETIWAFILFLQYQFSFKSKSKTQKITYIEDISSFVDFSQYVYCHRAQKIITLYIHWHMNWMVSPWKKMKKLEQWICKINTLTLLKIPKQ